MTAPHLQNSILHSQQPTFQRHQQEAAHPFCFKDPHCDRNLVKATKEMPISGSSMRVGKGSDSSEPYMAASSYRPYRPSPTSSHNPFNHGSHRFWSAATRMGFHTYGINRITWIIALLITTLLLTGVWNARQKPSVSLYITSISFNPYLS